MKPIISLVDEKLFADQEVQKWILENCSGIVFAGAREGMNFWMQHSELKNSFSLNGSIEGSISDVELTPYFDEPMSTPTPDNQNYKQVLKDYPNTLIGECDMDAIDELVKLGCNNITYTAYTEYIKIFGCRIGLFWTTQLPVWEKLEKKYIYMKTEDNHHWVWGTKFQNCWIKLGKDNREQIKWCRNHNKQLMIYSELPKDKLIQELRKIENLLK